MRDVSCAGYVAGGNTMFFGGENATVDDARENIQNRLSFSHELDGLYHSMLAFAAHAGQINSGHLDTACTVTSRLLPWDVTSGQGAANQSHGFPGGPSMYNFYDSRLQLRQIHFGEDMKAAENQDFISQVSLGFKPQPLWPTDAPCSLCVRARPTTPLALLDPTACTTRSRSRS